MAHSLLYFQCKVLSRSDLHTRERNISILNKLLLFVNALIIITLLAFLLLRTDGELNSAYSHQTHHNPRGGHERSTDPVYFQELTNKVNRLYQVMAKPIFVEKCTDCHGTRKRYSSFIVEPMINLEIKKAKKHLDISKDYPFVGHGNPWSDLIVIQSAVENDTMPTWPYRWKYPETVLTEDEKRTILHWVESSKKTLNPDS